MIDSNEFLRLLIAEFPKLEEDFTSNMVKGLIYSQATIFKDFTLKAIHQQDKRAATKCFALANKFLINGNDIVANSISVSFLEHLNFNKYNEFAKPYDKLHLEWKLLSEALNKNEHKKHNINDFHKWFDGNKRG